MKGRKRYFVDEGENNSYWPSFTDIMSTMMLVILLLALIAFLHTLFDTYQQREVQRELEKWTSVKEHISDIIHVELEEQVGKDQVSRGPNNTISLEGDILFETGSAEISEQGKQVLFPLSQAFQAIIENEEISDYIYIILIEGHTDRVPYDNWSLSTERAVAVLKHMLEVNQTLGQERYAQYFAATGYSEYKPLAQGLDEESLRKNRRISFQIILDDEKWQGKLQERLGNL